MPPREVSQANQEGLGWLSIEEKAKKKANTKKMEMSDLG